MIEKTSYYIKDVITSSDFTSERGNELTSEMRIVSEVEVRKEVLFGCENSKINNNKSFYYNRNRVTLLLSLISIEIQQHKKIEKLLNTTAHCAQYERREEEIWGCHVSGYNEKTEQNRQRYQMVEHKPFGSSRNYIRGLFFELQPREGCREDLWCDNREKEEINLLEVVA